MDQSLTGKKKAAEKHRQKKWRLNPDKWDMLEKLCSVLEVIFALISDFYCYSEHVVVFAEVPIGTPQALENQHSDYLHGSTTLQDDTTASYDDNQRPRSPRGHFGSQIQ